MARKKKRMPVCEAQRLLVARGVDLSEDYHALRSRDVDIVLDVAKAAGYRKSKGAPGSKARMFFAHLQRAQCQGSERLVRRGSSRRPYYTNAR